MTDGPETALGFLIDQVPAETTATLQIPAGADLDADAISRILAAVFEADPDLSAVWLRQGEQQSARYAAVDSSFCSDPAARPRTGTVPSCRASPPGTSFSSTGARHPDARSSNCASCSARTDRPAVRGGTDRLS